MRSLRSYSVLLIILTAAATHLFSQDGDTASGENEGPKAVKVYRVGPGISAPLLNAPDFSKAVSSGCRSKLKGDIVLQAVIDEHGVPRNISFEKATATDLDHLAVRVASLDRFTPAMKDGFPVAVAEKLEINLEGCVEPAGRSGKTPSRFVLAASPVQRATAADNFPEAVILASDKPIPATPPGKADSTKIPSPLPEGVSRVGDDISSPVPLNTPEAEFSDEARARHIEGQVVISLVVDIHGLPQTPHVIRPFGVGLDEKALEAVMRYRFKPALRNGIEPVPVSITITVAFRYANG